ncbi:hypothetical protein AURDEDRAFT_75671 [Auricularia subglabra TFB-10046 SS5]|uniref:Reverse transcriptase domain-containing protein n=1 Tax=Auricularia subglabra (strain TFB-10046 / SS5) TaxID=717982 RepID=J0LE02_AURST|nr:hypothetical protein AURDEDRAFT_75671 [Auricularia subglabra TFB-10046 SS5]
MLRHSTLCGFRIQGLTEKLIATLYADDTTVYLSAEDSYADLLPILERWCLAAGAKFNILKTEFIPIGSPEYREQMRGQRRLHAEDSVIPAEIGIAGDGEPTRILGSWPGNRVVNANAWSVLLDRLDRQFERWDKHHPTLNGRSMLAQMIAGGYTQYLTAVEGMPAKMEKKLDKQVLAFLWQGTGRHPINMDTLRLPRQYAG